MRHAVLERPEDREPRLLALSHVALDRLEIPAPADLLAELAHEPACSARPRG